MGITLTLTRRPSLSPIPAHLHTSKKNASRVQLSHACAGDINGDHAVNLIDLNHVLNNFGEGNPTGDAKADGDNDLADLNLVNGNFGAACDHEDYRYDYMNRLTSYVAGSPSGSSHTVQEHEYRYDALGRRVITRKYLGETYAVNTRFIYGGAGLWQLLEEYEEDFPTDLQSSHVYCGHAMDDALMYSFDDGGVAGFEDYYIHADEQFTVMAVSDDSGTIQERYSYGDYGEPTMQDGSGANLSPNTGTTGRESSAIGNRHLYTGQIFDEETGLSQYRYRYLHHGLGRFVTRDPLGNWGDRGNSGSAVAYVGSKPVTYTDALGLQPTRWDLPSYDPNQNDRLREEMFGDCKPKPRIKNSRAHRLARLFRRCEKFKPIMGPYPRGHKGWPFLEAPDGCTYEDCIAQAIEIDNIYREVVRTLNADGEYNKCGACTAAVCDAISEYLRSLGQGGVFYPGPTRIPKPFSGSTCWAAGSGRWDGSLGRNHISCGISTTADPRGVEWLDPYYRTLWGTNDNMIPRMRPGHNPGQIEPVYPNFTTRPDSFPFKYWL